MVGTVDDAKEVDADDSFYVKCQTVTRVFPASFSHSLRHIQRQVSFPHFLPCNSNFPSWNGHDEGRNRGHVQGSRIDLYHKFAIMTSINKHLSSLAMVLLSLGLCWIISLQYAFSMTNMSQLLLSENTAIASSVNLRNQKKEPIDNPQIVWLASFPNSGRSWCLL